MSQTVVLFPSVPVTPSTVSRREGWPWKAAAAGERARRGSATRAPAVPGGSSTCPACSTAAAPRRSASPMKQWPSVCTPGRAANRKPGSTARES